MSWAMALGPSRPRPAAVLALSGFLPRVDRWPLTLTGLEGFPVAIAHGSLDPVIPAGFGIEAADALEAAGAAVERLLTPVPHTVDPAWLLPLRSFVLRVLPPG
jgi:predicted esterase